jgi:hypothetical protein
MRKKRTVWQSIVVRRKFRVTLLKIFHFCTLKNRDPEVYFEALSPVRG